MEESEVRVPTKRRDTTAADKRRISNAVNESLQPCKFCGGSEASNVAPHSSCVDRIRLDAKGFCEELKANITAKTCPDAHADDHGAWCSVCTARETLKAIENPQAVPVLP